MLIINFSIFFLSLSNFLRQVEGKYAGTASMLSALVLVIGKISEFS
jgi:hypothetical protein